MYSALSLAHSHRGIWHIRNYAFIIIIVIIIRNLIKSELIYELSNQDYNQDVFVSATL